VPGFAGGVASRSAEVAEFMCVFGDQDEVFDELLVGDLGREGATRSLIR
jgi:hypothetical protein